MLTSDLQSLFSKQHANQYRIGQTTAEERIVKLRRLHEYLSAHVAEACDATYQDFRKPAAETIIGEILVLTSEINYAIKNLSRWMKPHKLATPLSAVGTSSAILYEPKGCCLIIAPWNYPINLALKPLISAIAAGCVAIVKPSELTPNAAGFVRKTIENLFSPDEVLVVEGDADIAQALLKLPFNHIFFTGSPAVGKLVMKAAAEHLASVTLELGGKSPSIVDETADIRVTAERIAWGKFFNNGQTCIAPDYVLVQESVHHRFVQELKIAVEKMYNAGKTGIEKSADYGRIVNERHFDRLTEMLEDAKEKGAIAETAGGNNRTDRFFSPVILTQANDTMQVMQDEIFGPILPVVKYTDLESAARYINGKEKPLALYIHSTSQRNADFMLKNTSAGNALVNELLTQFGNTQIPFGGVNNSGIGKSNGFYGFQEFSNAKGVMKRRFGTMKFLYPPYSDRLVTWLKWGLKYV